MDIPGIEGRQIAGRDFFIKGRGSLLSIFLVYLRTFLRSFFASFSKASVLAGAAAVSFASRSFTFSTSSTFLISFVNCNWVIRVIIISN